MANSNLPVVQKNNLPENIKKGFFKGGKILGAAAMTGLSSIAVVLSAATIPVLSIPAIYAAVYSAQKLLNQTLYKSHKDIAFITRSHKGNTKIYQDAMRPDITLKLRNMSEPEKAAFIQLQAIIGISKLDQFDRRGNPVQFETDSHSVVQKTFRKLETLGLLANYSENRLMIGNRPRSSHLAIPKIAFGNFKGLKDKVPVYNIKFQLGDKKVDINDPLLRKAFPMVFSKRGGLLSKYNYNIIQNPDGTLSIDYNADKPFIDSAVSRSEPSKLREDLKRDTPSLQEQKDFAISFNSNVRDSIEQDKEKEDEK